MSLPVKFLRRIWSKQPEGTFFLNTLDRTTGEWRDMPVSKDHGKVEQDDNTDLYFTVNCFEGTNRENSGARPSQWLYADLDEADPECPDFVRPTIAWETSPGRYQALWLLSKRVAPDLHRKLNQRVTYLTGADKGGWGLNKVLRLPGTINYKHPSHPKVRILWAERTTYEPKELAVLLKSVNVARSATDAGNSRIAKEAATSILRGHRVPNSIRRKLKTKPKSTDDRSKVLFKLEGDLLKKGLSPEEVLKVVITSPWNKFRGHSDKGREQLWAEIHKHKEVNGVPQPQNERRLKVIPFQRFMYEDLPAPKWAVESVWSDSAHGIIAGPAKSYKTLIALDMAVSVASGTKFLDHFQVPESGPVIVMQAENSPALVQDRVMKIAHSRELVSGAKVHGDTLTMFGGRDLPMYFINNPEMHLGDDEDIAELDNLLGEVKPKLLLLDPWYLLAVGVDENSQQGVAPILEALMRLKLKHDTGVLLVHHFRKPKHDVEDENDLERISGTSVFGRWFQSALIVRPGEEAHSARLTPYHREFPPQGSIEVAFDIGPFGSLDYDLDVSVKREETKSLNHMVRELVTADQGILIRDLEMQLDVRGDRLRRLLDRGPYKLKPVQTGKKGRRPLGVWLRA